MRTAMCSQTQYRVKNRRTRRAYDPAEIDYLRRNRRPTERPPRQAAQPMPVVASAPTVRNATDSSGRAPLTAPRAGTAARPRNPGRRASASSSSSRSAGGSGARAFKADSPALTCSCRANSAAQSGQRRKCRRTTRSAHPVNSPASKAGNWLCASRQNRGRPESSVTVLPPSADRVRRSPSRATARARATAAP